MKCQLNISAMCPAVYCGVVSAVSCSVLQLSDMPSQHILLQYISLVFVIHLQKNSLFYVDVHYFTLTCTHFTTHIKCRPSEL